VSAELADALVPLSVLEQAEGRLSDALERNRALKAELATRHRPRTVSGGQVRCTECATYVSGALRRMTWPCPTAVAAGLDET
jgi:hypothetical protein